MELHYQLCFIYDKLDLIFSKLDPKFDSIFLQLQHYYAEYF